MHTKVNNILIECVKGDITSQPDITAIVNAANAQLRRGGGVAGAIHRAAGPKLEKECVPLGPIKPGEAVITGGHNLPNHYVIHCLGPVYGKDKPEDKLLANCYRNALQLAGKHQIESIAFPSISTGAFGYPIKDAVHVALKTVVELLPDLKHLRVIRFVLFSQSDYDVYESAIKQMVAKNNPTPQWPNSPMT
jgi:O-acetyl-ADP-ribose deacetylase (regulator of RNase III)